MAVADDYVKDRDVHMQAALRSQCPSGSLPTYPTPTGPGPQSAPAVAPSRCAHHPCPYPHPSPPHPTCILLPPRCHAYIQVGAEPEFVRSRKQDGERRGVWRSEGLQGVLADIVKGDKEAAK